MASIHHTSVWLLLSLLLALLFSACTYDGVFKAVHCESDEHCPPGALCTDGFCIADAHAPDTPGDGDSDSDTGPNCESHQLLCAGQCINPNTSATHCGACNNTCDSGEVCESGSCQDGCSASTTLCDGFCADTTTDPDHCNGCDLPCPSVANATRTCTNSQCGFACLDGFDSCGDDLCVDLMTDPAFCGDCDTPCEAFPGATASCNDGQCSITCDNPDLTVCPEPFADLDICTDTQTDPAHCGACDTPCLYTCTDGTCPIACNPAHAPFGGGDGTPDAPYTICTPAHLLQAHTAPTAHFRLFAVIDLDGLTFTPIGSTATPFTGHFDGDDFEIHHLTINAPTTSDLGLFAHIGPGGHVQALQLKDFSITGQSRVGALAGRNEGTVEDVHVTGVTISGSVEAAGGLVGLSSGSVRRSFAEGSVLGAADYSGGLIGKCEGCVVEESFSDVLVLANTSSHVGGLVGHISSSSTVENCYSVQNVNGNNYVGGLIGTIADGNSSVYRCYSLGEPQTTGVEGGLVASNADVATVQDSYWENGAYGGDSAGGDELPPPEDRSVTFAPWVSDGLWTYDDAIALPLLLWQ